MVAGKEKYAPNVEFSEDLAEIIGIILGDGNVFSYVQRGKGIAVRGVSIAFHGDEESYFFRVRALLLSVFGEKASRVEHKTRNARYLRLYGKGYVELFTALGLPPGNKITNNVTIPDWIFSNKSWLRACIRGLIDTDGSVYRTGRWTQICFRNHNPALLADTRRGLLKLGIFTSQITRRKIYVSRKHALRKLFNEIGFRNYKHESRFVQYIAP